MKNLVLGLLALGLVSACQRSNSAENKENKAYPVLEVVEKDTLISNDFVTDIQAKKNIEIRSRISGILHHIYVNEGQYVKKGQPLFKINDAELRMELSKATAGLQQATADVRMAEIELNQHQSLFNKAIIAKNELDMIKAKLEAKKAQRSFMEAERNTVLQKIAFTKITAPFDGVIDVIPFKEGSLIENGALLTTFSQLEEVYAYFSIPESLYFQLIAEDKLGKHQKIELVLPNGVHYDYKGTLKSAESEIDRSTGSIRFKVAFPNPEHLIKHGTSGKLVISETRKNVITIPKKSTFSIQDKTYVFVVDSNQKVRMRTIQIGAVLSSNYLVSRGIEEGDRIIYEGTQSLRDGDRIQISSKI